MKPYISINEANQIEWAANYYGNVKVNLRKVRVINEKKDEYYIAHAAKLILNQLIIYNMSKQMYNFLMENTGLLSVKQDREYEHYTLLEATNAITMNDLVACMRNGFRKNIIDDILSEL